MKRKCKQHLAFVLAILLGLTSGLGGGFSLASLNPATAFEAPAVEAADDVSAEELDAEETEEIEVEEEAIEDEASSEEFEETEAEEAEEESNEDLAEAEEAAADDAEEAVEETIEQDAEDEAGNDSDISEDQPISDAIISDEADSDEADALNEDAEEAEEVEATEEVAEDEADTLDDSNAICPFTISGSSGTLSKTEAELTTATSMNMDLVQENVSFADGKVSGTLFWLDKDTDAYKENNSVNGIQEYVDSWGQGYYLGIKFSNIPNTVSEIGVKGLFEGEGTPRALSDSPNIISRVVNSEVNEIIQWKNFNGGAKLVVWWKDDGGEHYDVYDVSDVHLETPNGDAKVFVEPVKATATLLGETGNNATTASSIQNISVGESTKNKGRAIKGSLTYKSGWTTYYTPPATADADASGTNPEAKSNNGYFMALKFTPTAGSNINYVAAGVFERNNDIGGSFAGNAWMKVINVVEVNGVAAHDTIVVRVPNKNSILRVVGLDSSGVGYIDATTTVALNTAASYNYDVLNGVKVGIGGDSTGIVSDDQYDLSELSLIGGSAAISSATLDNVVRKTGENSLVHVGDSVTFQLSGTIYGPNETNGPSTMTATTTDVGFGNNSNTTSPTTRTITNVKISGTRWTGELVAKATGATGGAAEPNGAITIRSLAMEGLASPLSPLTVVSRRVPIIAKASAAPSISSANTGASNNTDWKVNNVDYGAKSMPFGTNQKESKNTYMTATNSSKSGTGNIMAYEWSFLEKGEKTPITRYTYAALKDGANFSTQVSVPTLTKTSTGANVSTDDDAAASLKVTVKSREFFSLGGSLPSGVNAATTYTSEKITDSSVDGEKLFSVNDWSAESVAAFPAVIDYAATGTVSIDAANSKHKNVAYKKDTNPYAIGETDSQSDTLAAEEKSYIQAKYKWDNSTYAGEEFNLVAFKWDWTNEDGTEETWYTLTGGKVSNPDEGFDGNDTYTSKLYLPTLTKKGEATLSVSIKKYFNSGSNANKIPNGFSKDRRYAWNEISDMLSGTSIFERSGWGSGKETTTTPNVQKFVVVNDQEVRSIEIYSTGVSWKSGIEIGQGVTDSFSRVLVGPPVSYVTPFEVKPAAAASSVAFSAVSANTGIARVDDINPTTGIATITGVSKGETTITYTANQNGVAEATVSVPIKVVGNTFDWSWDGTNGSTIYSHDGEGTIDLDAVFKNPSATTQALNNVTITVNGDNIKTSEAYGFDYTYDYPTGTAGVTAREMYTIGTDKKLNLVSGKTGATQVVVNVDCGKYGAFSKTLDLFVEAVIPANLTFKPSNLTVKKTDTDNSWSVSAATENTVGVSYIWSVDSVHSAYMTATPGQNGTAVIRLTSGASSHFTAESTPVDITVSASQTFKDGWTQRRSGSGTFRVNVSASDITITGAEVTETVGTKTYVKATTSGTAEYGNVALRVGDIRTMTAAVLPNGADPSGNWTWTSSDASVVTVSDLGAGKYKTASIKAVGAGNATVTARPNGSTEIAATFNVNVHAIPSAPDITLMSSEGVVTLGSDKYYTLNKGKEYGISYAGASTIGASGYGIKIAIEGETQINTSGEKYTPIELGSSVKTSGVGTITAKEFSEDATTFAYSLVFNDEYGTEVGSPIDGTEVSMVVDNNPLSTANPVTLSPAAVSVEPGGEVSVSAAKNPTAATGLSYKWELVDHETSHGTGASDKLSAANEKFAKIVGSAKDDSVIIQGLKNGAEKVDLKLTFTQTRLDSKHKTTENESFAPVYAAITVSGTTVEVEDLTLYVDSMKDVTADADSVNTYSLANKVGKSMVVSSAILPENAENKEVMWTLTNGKYATIKGSTSGTSATGDSVEIIPNEGGDTGIVTLTATATGASTPISKSIRISVKPVTLEDVTIAKRVGDTYEELTEDTIRVNGNIEVVALPYPRSADVVDASTDWNVWAGEDGKTESQKYINLTKNGSTATISGNKIGGPDYVEATMTDGTVTKSSSKRLKMTVSNTSVPFTGVSLSGTTGVVKVKDSITIDAKYTPTAADPTTLEWKTTEDGKDYLPGVSSTKYATLSLNTEKTQATITGKEAGEVTVTAKGTGASGAVYTSTYVVTVTEDVPNNIVVSSIKVGDQELKDEDSKGVYAIVPAGATVSITAKAMKDDADASNTNVDWYNGTEKLTTITAPAAGGELSLTGKAAAKDTVTTKTPVVLYAAPILNADIAKNANFSINDGEAVKAEFTGDNVNPDIALKFRNYTLVKGTDYTVTYPAESKNVGSYEATIAAVAGGKFTAAASGSELKAGYSIAQGDLSKAALTFKELAYTGSELTPEIATATLNDGKISLPVDDLVLISDRQKNVGSYEAQFQAKAGTETATNFAGIAKGTFSIAAKSLTDKDVALSATSFTYNGKAQAPTISTTLTADDYSATIPSSTNAGEYTVKVEGKGNYTGSVDLKYTIKAATLTNKLVSLSKTSFTYNGKKQTPTVKATSPATASDYTAAIPSASTNAATYTVKVTGQGNYTGSVNLAYTIAKASNPIKISSAKGSKLVTKTTNVKSLVSKAQGTVTYATSDKKTATVTSKGVATGVKPGKATITVKAAGNANYKSGSVKYTLTVTKLAKPTSVKLTNSKKKQLGVSWKKVSNATGYRVFYSTNKNMKSAKTKDVKTTKATLTKLTSKKTYYVQVRAYVKSYSTNNANDASSKVSKKVK
ncbi:MAG: fibronectin type III domain-containing protein [Lachnospiraceae bacterium]|nr:fibronectin type III domain-containing protein [Lachnospiraceae bacterium]